jgi:hypothetical protein
MIIVIMWVSGASMECFLKQKAALSYTTIIFKRTLMDYNTLPVTVLLMIE